jgi:tryptophanyl-tRNA synthetase
MDKVTFSGIQPSGNLHIGNYLGAVRHWERGQDDGLNIFCVVDMHAITVEQDPGTLRESTLSTAALLIAAGIDPEKAILFVQSHNPDHANGAWVMNCNISMGQMSRMTQFKEKSEGKDSVSVGLFTYPALMAADILLYNTTHVPIGEDQKQHVELARDVAQKFNSRYGETFILPDPVIGKTGARVMSLADPTKKMSKSDPSQSASVFLFDEPEVARKKIMAAVTDSGSEIKLSPDKPGITNLLGIYAEFSGISAEDAESKVQGLSYSDFKGKVADVVTEKLKPLQEKYAEVRKDDAKLLATLQGGAQKAREISNKKLDEIYEKVGFVQ